MGHNKKILVMRGWNRRQVLGLLRGTTAALLVGCVGKTASAQQTPITATAARSCVVKPEQTEGPYFVDEKLNRSDIRLDPSDNFITAGTELRLVFRVSRINGNACTPLANAIVDVWHCDAAGVYSDVQDRSFNTQGKKFLRGYQATNQNGVAQFVTIYPGWYEGRTVHIHFKIRTAGQPSHEFTSQLYFEDALSDRIYSQAPYAAKGQRTQRNDRDGIFQDQGKELLLQVTQDQKGYIGTFDIGLQMA